MKKLILFIGLLFLTLVLQAIPVDTGPDDVGVFIEQPNDFVTVEVIDVTVEKVNFDVFTYSMKEGMADDYSSNYSQNLTDVYTQDYVIYENQSDIYFRRDKNNYMYILVAEYRHPPTMSDNFYFYISNLPENKEFLTENKILLFGAFIC